MPCHASRDDFVVARRAAAGEEITSADFQETVAEEETEEIVDQRPGLNVHAPEFVPAASRIEWTRIDVKPDLPASALDRDQSSPKEHLFSSNRCLTQRSMTK